MNGKTRLLALAAIVGLILASCSINAPAATALPTVSFQQNTTPVSQPVIAQQTVQPLALTLTTTANPTTYDQVGRQIVFTYTITNSGTASVGPTPPFTVTDTLLGATPLNCGSAGAVLAPSQTVTCTATYTVTQADMNAVSVTSVATASGGGAGPSPAATATVNKGPVPTANPTNLTPGSTIQHTVIDGEWIWQLGRCYGVSPASIIAANPQLEVPAEISPKMVLTIPNLGSAGTIHGLPCVVEYTVKSGDTWTSIAQQYNADPTIMQMITRNSLTVGSKVFVPRNSASGSSGTVSRGLALTTSANPTVYDQVGQQITFTYVIRNSGNTTLGPDQFRVTDSLISQTPFNCGNPGTTIAPNATITCTAAYSVKQADLGAVSITNIATASGGGVGPSAVASTTVNRRANALTLTTTANPTTYDQANQQITFNYVITNSGAGSLGPDQFSVTDTLISATPFPCGVPNTTLAPNATVTCSAIYTITQNDMNAVSVSNLANATGGGVSTTQAASAIVNKAVKSISLTTTASPLTYNQAGQQITFQYVIRNTGTVALGPGQFTVNDSLIGAAPINCGAAGTTLAPTATVNCTGTYTIKPEDVNAVSVTSVAVAIGPGVGPSSPATATVNKQ